MLKVACHPKSICYAITIILWLLWIWGKSSSFFIHADGCNFRVRRGFAQIWCSDPFEAMAITGLRCNFGPVPPFLVFRFPLSVFRFPFLVPHSSIFPVRSPFFVGVTSYYCYDTTVVSSKSDFRKHLSLWAFI